MTEFLADAEQRLTATSPTPRLDAEVLLMHVCPLNRAELLTAAWRDLDPVNQQTLKALLDRRAKGEPIAYLVGKREFWSLDLKVTSATLIPRPETERLVEVALARIPHDAEWRVADLGTGCGAVAIAIAHERPHCEIVATDASQAALTIAEQNLQAWHLSNVLLRQGDWVSVLDEKPFEMIVSNPPYVRHDDPHLEQGDVRFEPRLALDGGIDGLAAIRKIAEQARRHLHRDGCLIFEHGFDQADAVRQLLQLHGYRDIVCHHDLSGHPRVTEARAPALFRHA